MSSLIYIVLIAALSILANYSFGQMMVEENALVFIDSGSVVSITSDRDAEIAGLLENEGILSIASNWKSSSQFISSKGSVILSNYEARNLNFSPTRIGHLVLDGDGSKRLNGVVFVKDSFTLFNGILSPVNNSRLILEPEVAIQEGNDFSYVDGYAFHQGRGKKLFPVGIAGKYLPLTLHHVEDQGLILGYRAIDKPVNGYPGKLAGLSDQHYWEQMVLEGDFTGSLANLKVYEEDQSFRTDQFVVTENDSLGGKFINLGQGEYFGSLYDGFLTSKLPTRKKYLTIGFLDLDPVVYVPNALSRTSIDPEEQAAKVYGDRILNEGFRFVVFNRWGNRIYESRSLETMQQQGWPGIHDNGRELAGGTYSYVLQGQFEGGKSFERTGSILIVE